MENRPNQIKTPVCIIGAGPAGISASITLSKQGIDHLIVDGATFPRHKPCGDIMPSQVIRELNDLDPEIFSRLTRENRINPIWHTLTYPPNGKPIHIDYLPFNGEEGVAGCFSISRYEFDQVLIDRMMESPHVTFEQGCRITGIEQKQDYIQLQTEDKRQIVAEMLIVATGSNNSILKLFGLEQPKSDCAIGIRGHFKGLGVKSSVTELFLDHDLMPGGFYITPLPGDVYNVNLVISLEKVKAENLNLREVFESYVARHPILKNRFEKAERIGNFEGSMLFLGIHKKSIAGNRFMVIGDSAGLIEIMSGNGIPQAFMSGKYAARQAIEAIQTGDYSFSTFELYEKKLFDRIGKNYSAGRLFYPALHKKWISRSILSFLNYLSKRPKTNALLRDLLYEKNPNKLLRNPVFYYKLLIK
jgi:flavin-dependent dehydrogenase